MSKKISYCWFPYSTHHYLTHPWKWIHDLNTGIKNLWHRAFYGYAWVDLWNTDAYLGELVPNMLDELAEKSCGWPGEECGYPEPEDWIEEMHILAWLMRRANYDLICKEDKFINEFEQWRDESILTPIKHLSFYDEYKLSESDAAAIDAENHHYQKLNLMVQALRKVIMKRVLATIDSWWD